MTTPTWYIVDAKGKTLGRMATRIAHVLRGKHHVTFVPYKEGTDHVIVTNASGVILQGNKIEQKVYRRHSGYFGNMKEIPVKRLLQERPQEVITRAVKGMLPRNRLRARMMLHLHVYPDATHPYDAQKPQALDAVFPASLS
jgi:large subunit ribosomal protein L13